MNLSDKLLFCKDLLCNWDTLKSELCTVYGQLSDILYEIPDSSRESALSYNKDIYSVALDPLVVQLMAYKTSKGQLDDVAVQYKSLTSILTPSDEHWVLGRMSIDRLNSVPVFNGTISLGILSDSLKKFGLTEADSTIASQVDDQLTGENVDTSDFGNYFSDNDIDLDSESSEIFSEAQDTLETSENESAATEGESESTEESDWPFDADGNEVADTSEQETEAPEVESVTQAAEQPTVDNNADRIERVKALWSNQINTVVTGIMTALSSLYSSGYGLVTPGGLLTDKGAVRSFADGRIGVDLKGGDPVLDSKLYRVINEASSGQFSYFLAPGTPETLANMNSGNGTVVMTELHLQAMFCHIRPWTGRNSVRKFLTENGINNASEAKVIKWDDAKQYIRKRVDDIFYDAYIEAGLDIDYSQLTAEISDKAEKISIELSRKIKNVVIISERKKNVNTRIRICTDTPIREERLSQKLIGQLNIGTSSNIKVDIKRLDGGVVDINVVYNEKAYKQDALFAYKVLPILKEQEIKPSWGNVILGKDLDGNILTKNFKDPNNAVSCIYGAQGSGKGVMTLNLIASALADGCDLIYMDAKPDTGYALVNSAWAKGKDAFVFNGIEFPGAPLEMPGKSIRHYDRFISKQYIPEGMFNTPELLERFILLTTYYRGVEITLRMAEQRASELANGIHHDSWLVAVFDECEQLASIEIEMMKKLNEIQASRKKVKEEVTTSKGTTKVQTINYIQDPIYKFINSYIQWRSIIKMKLSTALFSTYRKAEMSAIFIWQDTMFPAKFLGDKDAGSMVAYAIAQQGRKLTKFMGRGAAETGGSTSFGTPNSMKNATWYDDKFTGRNGGYWAMGLDPNSDDMTVFRPFNVYSNAGDKKQLLINARAAGLTESDLYDVSLNPDGTVIPEIGFEGYTNKMLAEYGLDTATQLNIGFQHVQDFIVKNGLGSSALEFMYNAHDFSYEGLASKEEAEEAVSEGFDPSLLTLSDEDKADGWTPGFQGYTVDNGTPAGSGNAGANNSGSRFVGATETRVPEPQNTWQPRVVQDNNNSAEDDFDFGNDEPVESGGQAGSFGNGFDAGQAGGFDGGQAGSFDGEQPYGETGEQPYPNCGQYESQEDAVAMAFETLRQAGIPIAPEVIANSGRQTFTRGTGANTGYTQVNPDRNSKVYVCNPNNSINIGKDAIDIPAGIGAALIGNISGASYCLDRKWRNILSSIENHIGEKGAVVRVILFNRQFVVNNKQIILSNDVVGGDSGIELRDIVKFKDLAKRFRNIKELQIDTDMYNSAYYELGDKPEVTMFNLFRALKNLTIWENGSRYDISRQSLNQAMQGEVAAATNRQRLKRELDAASYASNPVIGRTSAINKFRASRAINGVSSIANSKKGKVALGVIGGAGVAATVASFGLMGLALPAMAFGAIRGLFRSFR